MRKLEVFYLANKSPNLYFALLGDCSQSSLEEETFDQEVIEEGRKQVEQLNKKYQKQGLPIFHFMYRKRTWNDKEDSYLGWERKRGMLNQFNEYLLGNELNLFRENSIKDAIQKDQTIKLPKFKYVITLDADTDLILNSASELIGAMAHILNKPEIDLEKNIVVDGYGIMQPRVGVNLDISYQTLFTQIFAGAGGIDSYTNAISDIYQDNFKEGIFTGKGIYDLEVFSKVLKKAIPENKVLSHDLLEGSYLRCGLASDILLMDGYPTKYNSFMTRLTRWIRGDWQIIGWLKPTLTINGKKIKNPLNLLSKYKIKDNLRRSLLEISVILSTIYMICLSKTIGINTTVINSFLILSIIIPFLLEIINHFIFKKEGEQNKKHSHLK